MIYSVTTCNHLCSSKFFPAEKEDILKQVQRVILCTEEFRKKWPEHQLKLCQWGFKVTKKEIEDSVRIVKLEIEEFPFIKDIFCNGETPINSLNLKLTIESEIKKDKERKERLKKLEEEKLLEAKKQAVDKKNDDSKSSPERRVLRRIHREGSSPSDKAPVASHKKKEKVQRS